MTTAEGSGRRDAGWRRVLRLTAIVAVYVAAVVVFTWPLARDATDHLPDPVALLGPSGWPYVTDIHHHAWGLSWLARALTTAPLHLFDAPVFHPAPDSLAYTEHFLGHAPVAVPTYLLSHNPVLTFNLVLLSCYLGCALSMHALAWHWTGSHAAAFVAGIIHAFNARRLVPSFLLEYAGAIWLPLVPLLLERWADTGRIRHLVGLCLVLTLQTLCSYYLGYAAFLTAGLTGALLLLRGRLRWKPALFAAVPAAMAAGLVAVVSQPYLHLHAGGALPPAELGHIEKSSLALSLVAPGAQFSIGWATLVLAVLGLARASPAPGGRAGAVVLLVGGVLIGCGPYARIGALTVPLPYLLLYKVVPGFDAVRFPALLLATAEVGLAALAGLGAATVAAAARRLGRLPAAVAATALVGPVTWDIAGRARVAMRPLPVGDAVPAVYRALAAAPPGGAVLELPMGGPDDPRAYYRETHYMVLGTYHWHPLVNGYSDFTPATYDLLSTLARRLPQESALADLVDLAGVRWLIVHAPRLAPGWAELERAGAVRRTAADAGDTLFEVTLAPRRNLEDALRAALRRPADHTLEGTPLVPLPAGVLDGGVQPHALPPRALPGQFLHVAVNVRNPSPVTWPGLAVQPTGLVVVELRWIGAEWAPGPPAATVRLPRDLAPGDSATVEARVATPPVPGSYQLDVRLHQDVAGGPMSDAARVPITVALPAS